MSRKAKVPKAVQKMADDIWESLRAYAATMSWVPEPRKEELDDRL